MFFKCKTQLVVLLVKRVVTGDIYSDSHAGTYYRLGYILYSRIGYSLGRQKINIF